MNNIIKAGDTLEARSFGDYDCIFRAEVLSRTAKTATVRVHGDERRCRVQVCKHSGGEYIKAMGSYSGAPRFYAD